MIYMNLQIVLNTQIIPYLNQAAQRILAKIFLPKQIQKSKIAKQKNHLIIPVTWNPEYSPTCSLLARVYSALLSTCEFVIVF